MPSPESTNWLYDCPQIEEFSVAAGVFGSHADAAGAFPWEPHDLAGSSSASIEGGDNLLDPSSSKEPAFRKRPRLESSGAPGSKACREKMRRDKLNDKFTELGAILDPEKGAKMDKAAILCDAMRMVTQLRNEAQKLKDSNDSLKEKINELKMEKNELRDEKQRLKEEKSNLEQQMKTMSVPPPSFMPYPPMVPCFAPVPGDRSKVMMPYVAHPGFMFPFQAPASADDKNELPPAA